MQLLRHSARSGTNLSGPRALALELPNACAATPGGTKPGLQLDGIIGAISIPHSLQFSADPRLEIPTSCKKVSDGLATRRLAL
jgi:hypothetical protein